MPKPFMDADFLLDTDCAVELYHKYAEKLPVIDYHNHLNPADIASDRRFADIATAALEGDHYKWRAMRANGISETLVTGKSLPRDRWQAWAATVPMCLRNPLYHWQHLELQRYFGIHELLSPKSADAIFDECNRQLQQPSHSANGLLRQQRVEALCTTDDPADSLEFHLAAAQLNPGFKTLPTYRPETLVALDEPHLVPAYLERLGASAGTQIKTLDDALAALKIRHDFFHSVGCRISDHGMIQASCSEADASTLDADFTRLRQGQAIDEAAKDRVRTRVLLEVGRWNSERGWAMQLHLGPMRNNNSRLRAKVGLNAGTDSIGDRPQAEALSRFLDALERDGKLPKTILYNLNPRDNAVFATMAGNFQDGTIPGKIQFGSGWWFLDQLDGMRDQMNMLSQTGLISRFVGMLTDSRSFLSFPRHEYFRRLLCQLFGRDVEAGLLPDDRELLGAIIEGICYRNAKEYFKF